MQQLELFEDEGPQPIQRWLHVWSDAERALRLKKNPPAGRLIQPRDGSPANRGEEDGILVDAVCKRTTAGAAE